MSPERVVRSEHEPRTNYLIKKGYNDNSEPGFIWNDTCKIVTDVLTYDTNWVVIKACLERLGRILENMSFVRTADRNLVRFLSLLFNTSDLGEQSVQCSGEFTRPS